MSDEERDLVDEMAKSMSYIVDPFNDGRISNAENALSVVKSNLGKICMRCPACRGAGWYAQQVSDSEQEQRQCERCNMTGIVPKGK